MKCVNYCWPDQIAITSALPASREPRIREGELWAKGTRIPVTVIVDSLGEGFTMEAILASHPSLKPEHMRAALAYAAELAHGHDADTVFDESLAGAKDQVLPAVAYS